MGIGCFANDYASARAGFVAACRQRGVEIESCRHPNPGPNGEQVFIDIALFGNRCAAHLLIVISGTHGVEGFVGSAAQVDWMHNQAACELPPDTAVLLVHMLNPWGAAWLRRETENNVDLNRNFTPHVGSLPINLDYEKLHTALVVENIDHRSLQQADEIVDTFIASQGYDAFLNALSGQSTQPDGLYFGGSHPAWSNLKFREIVNTYVSQKAKVLVLDMHSGLGPYGYGSVLTLARQSSAALILAQEVYGDWLQAPLAEVSEVPKVQGSLLDGFAQSADCEEYAFIVLEFGTYDVMQDVRRHRLENWCWRRGDHLSERCQKIKSLHLEQAYPLDQDWRRVVLCQSRVAIQRALTFLNTRRAAGDGNAGTVCYG